MQRLTGTGGVQPYLRYIFGDVFGFLAAWTWIVAVMPATLAILALVFIESIYSAAGITDQADRIEHKLLSILILVVISVANSISTKTSTRLNFFFVLNKYATILAVLVAGLVVIIIQATQPNRDDIGGRDWFTKPWFGSRQTVNPDGSTTDWERLNEWELLGHYSTALYGALWAYSGHLHLCRAFSAGQTTPARYQQRNPRYRVQLHLRKHGLLHIAAVERGIYNGQRRRPITRLLGQGFGIVAAIFICIVVAGSLIGNSFVAGRMTVAAANQGWLSRAFAVLGQVGVRKRSEDDAEVAEDSSAAASDAPVNAIILSTVLAALYILLGNFRALLTFNGLGEYSFFFLTVLGAILLRVREPGLRRPYKPFILVPTIFALVSGFVVVRGAIFAPVLAAVLIVLWVIGGALYFGLNGVPVLGRE
ncbi:hypothetical protein NUW58_g8267 [Xylaria curta]|uniref:Uncharacterized protein n=1 Tax=Xylaria curta TaxID=42375 RepID=A0ACC1N9V4_9PEZI|nr:hypothetical protein NUW58_g8267 [Xylaria curta]